MKTNNYQSGYIALISAILISVSLLTLVIAVSFEGFYSRFNVLESEQKEISAYLAESCVNTAILKIAQDEDYAGNEPITVGDSSCYIATIQDGELFISNRLIKTQGIHDNAYTNLKVEVDPDNISEVVGWTEVKCIEELNVECDES